MIMESPSWETVTSLKQINTSTRGNYRRITSIATTRRDYHEATRWVLVQTIYWTRSLVQEHQLSIQRVQWMTLVAMQVSTAITLMTSNLSMTTRTQTTPTYLSKSLWSQWCLSWLHLRHHTNLWPRARLTWVIQTQAHLKSLVDRGDDSCHKRVKWITVMEKVAHSTSLSDSRVIGRKEHLRSSADSTQL